MKARRQKTGTVGVQRLRELVMVATETEAGGQSWKKGWEGPVLCRLCRVAGWAVSTELTKVIKASASDNREHR